MRIDQQVRKRAADLVARGEVLSSRNPQYSDPAGRAMLHECEGWLASALNLLKIVSPDPLSAYQSRAALLSGGRADRVGGMVQILKHLLADVDAGVVSRVAEAARAEAFDDFLDQADYYLRGRKIAQAGVIAGVVFEDTVRRICDRRAIPQKGVDLEQLITALVKSEVILEVKAKRARAAGGLRTKATHAQWDEFSAEDVDAAIRLTRELIDTIMS
jgi:hypothetical protein